MTQPILLTIQIPYTEERQSEYDKLVAEFNRQIKEYNLEGLIEIQSDSTGKEMTIGEKRNILYSKANGVMTTQWDSDDWIHPEGFKLIIDAIKSSPDADCVTYGELVSINGKTSLSNISLRYFDWEGDGNSVFNDGFSFHRTPFFKCPIKTDICKKVGVNSIRFGEDHDFSQRIRPLLNNEIYIGEFIYHYIHESTDHTTRYGFDKDKTQ